MKLQLGIILLLSGLFSTTAICASNGLPDGAIKRLIIQESIASYPGRCPCPYNVDRAGRSCGRRSAYSRPGGYSPICYEGDVTPQMVQQYRASNNR
jgi:hypothetical protein